MVFWVCCSSQICLFIYSDFNRIIVCFPYLLSKEENNQLFLFSICDRLTCLGFFWIPMVNMTTVLELAIYPFFKLLVWSVLLHVCDVRRTLPAHTHFKTCEIFNFSKNAICGMCLHVGFPAGWDFLVPQDKGTEVPSLSRDNRTDVPS